MVSVYDFDSYRDFLNAWIDASKARGSKSRLAQAAGVSASMMSLIFKGEKLMSMEQAAEVAEFLNLNDLETDFFLLLVELGRAGSFKLRRKLERKKREMQAAARKITNRVKKDRELSDEQKAIYYSNWVYTGARNLAAISEYNTAAKAAARLGVSEAQLAKVIEFLVENGLVKRDGDKLEYGPRHLHLGTDSPFLIRHHQNWRLQGFKHMEQHTESNLFYTCPMSLSNAAVEEVRKLLPVVIDQVLKIVGPSESERAFCFNMDWYEY